MITCAAVFGAILSVLFISLQPAQVRLKPLQP